MIEYTKPEQDIVDLLQHYNAELPKVILTNPKHQLITLARCHGSPDFCLTSEFLCCRVMSDKWLPNHNSKLVECIRDSIQFHPTLQSYLLFECGLGKVMPNGCVLRDVWIKQMLHSYSTTVSLQLKESNKLFVYLSRWWNNI